MEPWAQASRYHLALQVGLCPICMKRKAMKDAVRCSACAKKLRKHNQAWSREQRRISSEAGNSTTCCRRPAAPNRKTCTECLEHRCAMWQLRVQRRDSSRRSPRGAVQILKRIFGQAEAPPRVNFFRGCLLPLNCVSF